VETFKTQVLKVPGVVHATTSNHIPGDRLGRTFDMRHADQPTASNFTMSFLAVDYSFFDAYDVPLVTGRKFNPTDHYYNWNAITNTILNMNGVRLMGFETAEEAIGKQITFWDKTWTVVGVVSDFHQQALKRPMEPMVFFPSYGEYNQTSIKIRESDLATAMGSVETIFKETFPENAFEYFALEDRFNRQYSDDNRFGKVVSIFTVLAILIACLGLIGLSSYTAIQRTKEIGIRKVLGASVFGIVTLLSSSYLKLIAIASVVALPIAYYGMVQWLDGYAYRIPLTWALFVMPILAILVIAVITVSFQLIKAAAASPSRTLKYE
jgi:putative ABC transport system permease protein